MGKTSFVIEENNSAAIKSGLEDAIERALTKIGIKAEGYAKALCPVGTPESTKKKGYRGGTLRNSITYEVDKNEVTIGTNVEYAPYVELGTGPYFSPPPEWEQFDAPRGSGAGHGYVKPRPFLKPAIMYRLDEYGSILENELKG